MNGVWLSIPFGAFGLLYGYWCMRVVLSAQKGPYESTVEVRREIYRALVAAGASSFLFWASFVRAVNIMEWLILLSMAILEARAVFRHIEGASKAGEKRMTTSRDLAEAAVRSFLVAVGFFYIAGSILFTGQVY